MLRVRFRSRPAHAEAIVHEQGQYPPREHTRRGPPNQASSYDLWLDPGVTNVQMISELLKPYDAQLIRCYPESMRINYVENDAEERSAPVELEQTQDRLFT